MKQLTTLLLFLLLVGCAQSPTLFEVQKFCEGNVQEYKGISRDANLHIKCKRNED